MSHKMVKEEQNSVLDPELWKQLPQDLLERVVWKLPFASLVTFRTVSKHWCSTLVPQAGARLQESNRGQHVLLYFGHYGNTGESLARWMQVSNEDNEFQEFQSTSFPRPREGEYVRLLMSEGGLLFFGFIHKDWEIGMVRDIVVCNPLTAKSRQLGLPSRLGPYTGAHIRKTNTILIGVVFDSEMDNYKLVAAGTDEVGQHPTLLYDSSTCLWTNATGSDSEINCAYMLVSAQNYEDEEDLLFGSCRSVCCNGSLYWVASASATPPEVLPAVLKFEIASSIWTLIRLDSRVMTCGVALCYCHIAAHDEKILLWHLHDDPDYDENNPLGTGVRGYCHLRDSERPDIELQLQPDLTLVSQDMIDRLEWYLYSSIGGRSQLELQLRQNLSLMSEDEIDSLGRYPHSYDIAGRPQRNYIGFIDRDMLYHVVTQDGEMSIVQQNINENSITRLHSLSWKHLPKHHYMVPENAWGFSASLTAVP